MTIQVIATELPSNWLNGARREWVTSVISEPSESGVRTPVAQQVRPFLRFTFDVSENYMAAMEDHYIEANGPEMAFLCQPPLARDHQATAVPIGTGTGASQSLQLMIRKGQSWAALYPIPGTITIYGNGTPLVGWTLGLLGVVTGTATLGHAVTATFKYKTLFAYLENSFVTMMEYGSRQRPQQVRIEEVL